MRKSNIQSLLVAFGLCLPSVVGAQEERRSINPLEGLEYQIQLQGTASSGKTPLWLNANKYGLSSLEKENGYVRASVARPLATDSTRRWAIGYGVDVAAPYRFTSHVVVQQAFAEARWLHGTLTVGAKEYPMEMKNRRLSSGSQALGINARPVPQVRLALPDYWTLPFANGWMHLKGHLAYGIMTDKNWQHDFTQKQSRYTDGTLYHSKAGYLKIGNEEAFFPLSVEVGLEMATQFGGDTYAPDGYGGINVIHNPRKPKDFLRALIPSGGEQLELGTNYVNAEGNHLGSWLMRVNWDEDDWRFSVYADHFFEDHSAMFHLDYDGYGTGEEWNVRKKRRYLLYGLKDIMLGGELTFKYDRPVQGIVFEYLYTKYQSGPIYHDHTSSISDHIGGKDNYYNHYVYTGWQHWGQVMGNPLYRSPIYNDDGQIEVKDNRFMAFHLGVEGRPTEGLYYRVLGTWQEGLGTYGVPYTKKRHNVSFLTEATYSFHPEGALGGWSVTGGYAMDFGSILGHNAGFQLTITKKGFFSKRR